MDIKTDEILVKGKKFSYIEEGNEIARAFLYILKNDLHDEPFGFLEDVFVDDSYRGRGYGSELVKKVIEESRKEGCYKLICTSRYSKPEVHRLYENLGFTDHGKEFRIDLLPE